MSFLEINWLKFTNKFKYLGTCYLAQEGLSDDMDITNERILAASKTFNALVLVGKELFRNSKISLGCDTCWALTSLQIKRIEVFHSCHCISK